MPSIISLQEVQAYGALLDAAQRRGGEAAVAGVRRWMAQHPDASVEEVREASITIVAAVVDDYGAAAASAACDLYDDTMLAAGLSLPRAEPTYTDPAQQVRRAVKYQIQHLVDGDEAAYLDAVRDMTNYYVRRCANQTTMRNAERDNRYVTQGGMGTRQSNARYGQLNQPTANAGFRERTRTPRRRGPWGGTSLNPGDIAYARVPTGAETCTYCMMLASRGFAYHSEESAGHADHRGCNCLIVAGLKGQTMVEGVDPDEQYRTWKELASVDAKLARGEIDKDEAERRKREVVDAHPNATAQLPAAQARKEQSSGVRQWYTPLDYEAKGTLDAPRQIPL